MINSEQIQELKAKAVDRIIAEIKAKHSHYDAYAPVMTWGEFCTIVTERDADKALIAEQVKRIEFLKEQLALLANFNPDWDKLEAAYDSLREHMTALTAAQKRIAELEARMLTVKLPDYSEFAIVHFTGCSDDYAKGWVDGKNTVANAYATACAAAGITLVVGE